MHLQTSWQNWIQTESKPIGNVRTNTKSHLKQTTAKQVSKQQDDKASDLPYGPSGPASVSLVVSTQGALLKPASIHISKLIIVSGTESSPTPLHL